MHHAPNELTVALIEMHFVLQHWKQTNSRATCTAGSLAPCTVALLVEDVMPVYPLNLGDVVEGKYRIDAILGEGGMGVVFAATHLELHCPVALKVIREELNQIPELTARLVLEARAAAQIRSEHVCRVLDVGRLVSGTPFVVMEYLRGKTLAAELRAKGRLPERTAVDYVLQACEAIAEAHRAGFVHRDLKPENLFLAEFPNGDRAIKVLDFGISKMSSVAAESAAYRLTNPSAAMGSPHYMAPEQMLAAHDVDTRADIWALGAILHELVTGHLAFTGHSLPVICAAVLQSSPTPVRQYAAEVSPGFEEVILACLAKGRDHRPQTIAELARRIAPCGTARAAESAARIRRLFEDKSLGAVEDAHDGAPVTAYQKTLPHTPLSNSSSQSPRQPTPMETAAAVTSTKEVSSPPLVSSTGTATRRNRSYVRLASMLLLIPAGLALTYYVQRSNANTEGPSGVRPDTSAYPSEATLRRETDGAKVAEQAALGALGSPASTSHLPTTPATDVAPKQDAASSSSTTALSAESTVKQTSTAAASPSPRHGQPLSIRGGPKPLPPRPKGSTPDPYDAENFGGRR